MMQNNYAFRIYKNIVMRLKALYSEIVVVYSNYAYVQNEKR